MKPKARRHEPPMKPCSDPLGRTTAGRPAREYTDEAPIASTGLAEELEAKLAVTRICDLILGRLSDAETQDGRDLPRRRLK